MVLAELLQWLSMGQKTGTLVIDNKKITKKIVFDDGVIISSASTDPKEYLGRFLVNHGYIADDLIQEALAKQKQERQLLGKILVNLEAIAEEDLHQMLQLKAEGSIYDVFTWEEGDFDFLDNDLPEETMIRMSLDVQWIVLEGSHRLDEWSRIREVIPSRMCVPVSVADFDGLEIEEVDRRILDWIDDDRTVEEISHEAQTSLFQVASTLATQVSEKTVKVVRPRTIEIEVPVAAEPAAGGESEEVAVAAQQPVTQAVPPYPQAPAYAQPAAPPPATTPTTTAEVGGCTLHFAAPPPGAAAQSAPPGSAPPLGAPPPASEAERPLQLTQSALRSGDLEDALTGFRKAKSAPDASSKIEQVAEEGEAKVEKALTSTASPCRPLPGSSAAWTSSPSSRSPLRRVSRSPGSTAAMTSSRSSR